MGKSLVSMYFISSGGIMFGSDEDPLRGRVARRYQIQVKGNLKAVGAYLNRLESGAIHRLVHVESVSFVRDSCRIVLLVLWTPLKS